MSDKPEVIKLYPSSSDFLPVTGQEIEFFTKCLRYITVAQLNRDVVKVNINPLNKAVAEIDEARYFLVLKQEFDHIERETSFKYEKVAGYDELVLSGRTDYLIYDDPEKTKIKLIVEKKSSFSKSQKSKIVNGQISPSQLAQLLLYMVIHKVPHGRLVQSYYGFDSDLTSLKLGAEARWDIEIDKNNVVTFTGDGVAAIADLLRFYKTLADHVVKRQIAPKPRAAGFRSPCDFCPLNPVCQGYDEGNIASDLFFKNARSLLEAYPATPSKATITHYKRPMKQSFFGKHSYNIKGEK